MMLFRNILFVRITRYYFNTVCYVSYFNPMNSADLAADSKPVMFQSEKRHVLNYTNNSVVVIYSDLNNYLLLVLYGKIEI